MKCSDAVNCLAGHLLAAQLDVANGSSSCIAGTISDANAFLTSVGYAGPASYTISANQRAQALSLEQTLDNYTNDSSGTSLGNLRAGGPRTSPFSAPRRTDPRLRHEGLTGPRGKGYVLRQGRRAAARRCGPRHSGSLSDRRRRA
jgi:hypothetical protein